MTVKERVIEKLECLDDAQLERLEQLLVTVVADDAKAARVEQTLQALDAFLEHDPTISAEAWAEFDAARAKRLRFRPSGLEPDIS